MLSGWGGRSRTLTYGTRNRCPTIRRHPNNYAINNTLNSLSASRYISVQTPFRQDRFEIFFFGSCHFYYTFAFRRGTFYENAALLMFFS